MSENVILLSNSKILSSMTICFCSVSGLKSILLLSLGYEKVRFSKKKKTQTHACIDYMQTMPIVIALITGRGDTGEFDSGKRVERRW